MEKTFTRAGVSVLNGVRAYRFANDAGRERVLEKNGHTDIQFFELAQPLTKQAAIEVLNHEYGVYAENTKVSAKPASVPAPKKAVKRAAPAAPKTDVTDDGFVEPKDEATQVAMCRLAREYPGLDASQLYEMVELNKRKLGDTEPNF